MYFQYPYPWMDLLPICKQQRGLAQQQLTTQKGQRWSHWNTSFQHRFHQCLEDGPAIWTNPHTISSTYLSMYCHHNYGKENKNTNKKVWFSVIQHIDTSQQHKLLALWPPRLSFNSSPNIYSFSSNFFINQCTTQSRGAWPELWLSGGNKPTPTKGVNSAYKADALGGGRCHSVPSWKSGKCICMPSSVPNWPNPSIGKVFVFTVKNVYSAHKNALLKSSRPSHEASENSVSTSTKEWLLHFRIFSTPHKHYWLFHGE